MSEFAREENGCGAVGSSDDGDGRCSLVVESQEDRKEVSYIDAQLGSRSHEEALRIGDQGTEVCHSAYSHEDQGRQDTPLIQKIEVMKQTAHAVACLFRAGHDIRINIYQKHTEGNGNQKKRFEAFLNGKE